MCSDEVGDNDDSVHCDLCNKWNHTRCFNIDAEQYEKRKKDPLPWYCPNCAMEIPFSTLSNKSIKLLFLEAVLKLYLNHFQNRLTRKPQKS